MKIRLIVGAALTLLVAAVAFLAIKQEPAAIAVKTSSDTERSERRNPKPEVEEVEPHPEPPSSGFFAEVTDYGSAAYLNARDAQAKIIEDLPTSGGTLVVVDPRLLAPGVGKDGEILQLDTDPSLWTNELHIRLPDGGSCVAQRERIKWLGDDAIEWTGNCKEGIGFIRLWLTPQGEMEGNVDLFGHGKKYLRSTGVMGENGFYHVLLDVNVRAH